MGVNIKIELPGNVRLGTVADVIGILAGNPPERQTLQGSDGTFDVCRCPGVRVRESGLAGMAEIVIAEPGTLKIICETFYHFEGYGSGRLLMPRQTGFWIAVGTRLVAFFGGRVVLNDGDGPVYHERPARPDSANCPEDGKPYLDLHERLLADLHERLLALGPVTRREFDEAEKCAAYPRED